MIVEQKISGARVPGTLSFLVIAVVKFLVEEDDHGGADGHQEDHPGMLPSQLSGMIDAEREDAGHQTDKRAAEQAVDQKFDHLYEPGPDFEHDRFQLVSKVVAVEIHISPPVEAPCAKTREDQ